MRTYLSFFSCIEQTSHVSFRLDVCARCATMSATTWLVAENDRASILYLLASFSSVHSGRYWTICCKMGYTLLRVVLVFVFIALVLYTRKADQDNAFCFLSGGFAETPRADSRTRASRRDRPSPRWPRLLRRITPRGMACHVLLTSARRRLRLPECAGRASCRARRRSIARQIGNEGDSDARLEMQSKPPQGQMASRPFRSGGKKQNPLWDGSGSFSMFSCSRRFRQMMRARRRFT